MDKGVGLVITLKRHATYEFTKMGVGYNLVLNTLSYSPK